MASKTPPWKKRNPVKRAARKTLTAEQKERAKERARLAGRRYPNLVDNMAVARESNSRRKPRKP
jgi:hypothetical protein